MEIDFLTFANALMGDPILALIVLLTLGATIVNGATDAPNAIATVVGTRAMKPGPAIAMAAVCNFIGLVGITMVSSAVAHTIFGMVDFGGDNHAALVALAAAMVAIIVWGVAAWWFGIPTSQSHSLIAGITGAAIALQGGLGGVNFDEWVKVIYGLVISTVLGFGSGYVFTRLIRLTCKNISRLKAEKFFLGAQIVAGAGVAVLHGAQDGQKFLSLVMLGIALGIHGSADAAASFPFWVIIMVSLVMALGTAVGGKKIIKSVGMDMVKMEQFQGLPFRLLLHRSCHVHGHAGVHHAHQNHGYHGRGSREAPAQREVEHGGHHGAHLGAHLPRLRYSRVPVHASVPAGHVAPTCDRRCVGALRAEATRPPWCARARGRSCYHDAVMKQSIRVLGGIHERHHRCVRARGSRFPRQPHR